MNNAALRTALLIILGLSFLISGCRTLPATPDKPSDLRYQQDIPAQKAAEMLEAEVVARKLAERRLKEEKKEEKKELPPAPEKVTETAVEPVKEIPQPKTIQTPAPAQKIDSTRPLTLAELIDIGLSNNPQTRQAWDNVRLAQTKEKQAESTLYPQLTVAAQITRERDKATSPLNDINDMHYGPSATLTYLILDFGGRNAQIEQTIQEIVAADSQYNQAIQDLLLDVETAYYKFYSAQSAQEAAEDDVKNTKADFDAAQLRFEVGLVPQLDVLQAKSDYESSLYNLEEAKGQVKNTKAGLAQAIGVSADTEFEIAKPSTLLPNNIDEGDVKAMIEDALIKRPDVAALRANIKAQEAAIKSAFSNMMPTLNAGATGQTDQYKYYSNPKTKEHDRDGTVYASVNWDVFDGFYNLNKKREAERQLDIAKDKLAQKESAVSTDVWTKYYDFDTAASKLVYSEAFLNTSRTSYELAFESYNAGLKSILDLLRAESNLSQAKSRFIQSKEDLFIALAELAHAKGMLNNVAPAKPKE
jgi:TolC family type I secretion outer membrane protein